MCLQGFDQSGQEQSVCKSPLLTGKSDRPAAWKAFSISSGIPPARSFAAKSAWRPRASANRFQFALDRVATLIRTWYGSGREPCTRAETVPLPIAIESTCPRRAYDRPRPRRAPMLKLSRTSIQRLAHQLLPKVPPQAILSLPHLTTQSEHLLQLLVG